MFVTGRLQSAASLVTWSVDMGQSGPPVTWSMVVDKSCPPVT